MIYGNLNVKETEAAYSPAIRKALDILRTTDVTGMRDGRYPLDGDKLVLLVNEVTTAPKSARHPEVHKNYIDVQYMVHGRELIGFYPHHAGGTVLEDKMAENDVLFYQEREDVEEIMLPMTDGCYAIFFPEDVHRPGCMVDGPEEIKKLVVKIRVDTL